MRGPGEGDRHTSGVALGVSTPEEYSQQLRSRDGWAHFARTLDPDTGKEDDILYWNILRDRNDVESQITVVWFSDKKRCEIILDRVKHRYDEDELRARPQANADDQDGRKSRGFPARPP